VVLYRRLKTELVFGVKWLVLGELRIQGTHLRLSSIGNQNNKFSFIFVQKRQNYITFHIKSLSNVCLLALPALGRVHTIRDLNSVLVVSLALQRSITPSTSDLAENLATISDKLGVWDRESGNLSVVAERPVERAVEEVAAVGAGSSVPGCVLVSSLVSDEGEDVGTNIPTTQSVQVPVGLNSADLRIVVVELGISGTDELLGNSVTENDAEDTVLESVGVRLVESDQNKGVLHEVLVVEKRFQEAASPGTSSSDTRIVAI
jgi:hypothetical protein